MNKLGVHVYARDFSQLIRPPRVAYTVNRIGWRAFGGAYDADIDVSGEEIELWELLELLRCPVEITSPSATVIWSGYISAVEVTKSNLVVKLSLDQMSNRINLVYTEVNLAGQSGESAETGWIQDDESVAVFGTKEAYLSMGGGNSASASAYAALQLSGRRYPIASHDVGSGGDGTMSAHITCRGWWQTLDWRYYEDSAGSLSWDYDGEGELSLGQRVTGTTISFNAAQQTINDTTDGLLDLVSGDKYYIFNSASNNGWHEVTQVSDISAGSSAKTTNQILISESAGASISISSPTYVAQPFSISGDAWYCKYVGLKISKIGSPTKDVTVELRSDSSGNPGTVLTTGHLPASVFTDSFQWVTFTLADKILLQPGTTYWISVFITDGPVSPVNYYRVDVNEFAPAAEKIKVYITSAWIAPLYPATMLYQVGGVADTGAQLQRMFSMGGQFFSGVDGMTTGIDSSPYRDGQTTVLQCAEELMDVGTSDARRLLARVTPERWVVVYEEPAKEDSQWYIKSNGKIYNNLGLEIQPWDIPCGIWLRLMDVIPGSADTGKIIDASFVFVDGIDYNGDSGSFKLIEKNAESFLGM
ncbi:MAG: choice-of-anchor R domain-containing protein [Anaerolineaceae bacterium]